MMDIPHELSDEFPDEVALIARLAKDQLPVQANSRPL